MMVIILEDQNQNADDSESEVITELAEIWAQENGVEPTVSFQDLAIVFAVYFYLPI